MSENSMIHLFLTEAAKTGQTVRLFAWRDSEHRFTSARILSVAEDCLVAQVADDNGKHGGYRLYFTENIFKVTPQPDEVTFADHPANCVWLQEADPQSVIQKLIELGQPVEVFFSELDDIMGVLTGWDDEHLRMIPIDSDHLEYEPETIIVNDEVVYVWFSTRKLARYTRALRLLTDDGK